MRRKTAPIRLITAVLLAIAVGGWAVVPRDFCLTRLVSDANCCSVKKQQAVSCPCCQHNHSCCSVAEKTADSSKKHDSEPAGTCFQISSGDIFLLPDAAVDTSASHLTVALLPPAVFQAATILRLSQHVVLPTASQSHDCGSGENCALRI
jgi:hypothetical protein